MITWLPVLDTCVTCLPDGPASLTAGVELGFPPAGATKTWNEGPDAGAGVHWKAHPMFHGDAVMEKAGLVQLPCIWVAGTRSWRGPGAGPDVVEVEVAAVVVVTAGAVVVVVAPRRSTAPRCVTEWALAPLVLPGGSVDDGVVVVGAPAPDAAGGGSL